MLNKLDNAFPVAMVSLSYEHMSRVLFFRVRKKSRVVQILAPLAQLLLRTYRPCLFASFLLFSSRSLRFPGIASCVSARFMLSPVAFRVFLATRPGLFFRMFFLLENWFTLVSLRHFDLYHNI